MNPTAKQELLIEDEDGRDRRVVELRCDQNLLGRSPACSLVLDSPSVSRQHARLFTDPGRQCWIIEDLQSRNGVYVNGERVDQHTFGPGDRVTIGPFRLQWAAPQGREIPSATSDAWHSSVVTSVGREQLTRQPEDRPGPSRRGWWRDLSDLGERLSLVSALPDLYPETCRVLSARIGGTAMILRIGKHPDADAEVLARAGRDDPGAAAREVLLSQRVVQAMRDGDPAVMAGDVRLSPQQLELTYVGQERPRAVFCARIAEAESSVDACYLELSAARADRDHLDYLTAAARQVDLARRGLLLAEQLAHHRDLDRQLAMAREIQLGLTPRALDLCPALDVALHYKPALWVGGDYCDVWSLPDGRMALAVADVSGKGLPASLVMMHLRAALRTASNFRTRPTEIMDLVDRHLRETLPDDMFVTGIVGVFDPESSMLEYVNAGHLLPILVAPEPPEQLGRPQNPPLGILPQTFTADEVRLEPGWGLLIVTDGVTESRAPGGELLGPEGLVRVLGAAGGASAESLVRTAADGASAHRNTSPQQDDVTILAIRRRCEG